MSCDFSSKVMAWYDDELTASERAAVEMHLAWCASCAEFAAALRATSRMIVEAPRATMSSEARKRLEQAWWASRDRGVLRLAEWLTAAAAAVLIATLIFWSNGQRTSQTATIAWPAEAEIAPVSTRADAHEEVASNGVDLAEWVANDLAGDRAGEER